MIERRVGERRVETQARMMAALCQTDAFAGMLRIGVIETVVHTGLPDLLRGILDRAILSIGGIGRVVSRPFAPSAGRLGRHGAARSARGTANSPARSRRSCRAGNCRRALRSPVARAYRK